MPPYLITAIKFVKMNYLLFNFIGLLLHGICIFSMQVFFYLLLLTFCKLDRVTEKQRDEFSVSSVDDVVTILKSDYQNAYFVTGMFLNF